MAKKKNPVKYDPVNRPKHYAQFSIQPIEAVESWGLCHHAATAVAYVARAEHKGSEIEDYKKAVWYLNRLINLRSK